MVSVSCDICKKKVDDPMTDRTLFYYANHSICEPCKDSLEFQVRELVRDKEPFEMEWYRKTMMDSLNKGVQKGKI